MYTCKFKNSDCTVQTVTAYCAVKTSIPLLHWSRDKELLRWVVFTKCGKNTFIDRIRGSKHPLEIPCCGSYPLNPTKINYSLKEINEIIHPEPIIENESVECKLDMTKNQIIEIPEKLITKGIIWPEIQELSRLVNSQSMRSLAKQLNTSAGSIKKQCAKLGIIIPAARFNWSKV